MKVAIVDWKGKWAARPYLNRFRDHGIEYLFSDSLEDFISEHKSFSGCNGAIVHINYDSENGGVDESELSDITALVGIPWVRAAYGRVGYKDMQERPIPKFSLTEFDFEEFERYLVNVKKTGREKHG